MLQQMQETEQVEEKATYSFEEICPEWTQIMSDNGGFIECRENTFQNKDDVKSIMNCSTCIVGEAFA